MDDITIARAVHVLAVVHWIGGVFFVTSVILPTGNASIFQEVERRFSAQVKVSVPLAGLSGLYMTWKLDAWTRFLQPASWWLTAMALLWLLFMAMLFVVEPLALRHGFAGRLAGDASGTLAVLQRAHTILLALGLAVVAAGVAGAHGLLD
jgi:uncharacterized membrane protein